MALGKVQNMKSTNPVAGLASAAILCCLGGTALASTFEYDTTFTGSGYFQSPGSLSTPFTDLTVKQVLYVNPSTAYTSSAGDVYVQEIGGSLTYSGVTTALTGHKTGDNSGFAFAFFDGSAPGVAGPGEFADGPHTGAFVLYNAFYSPALEGYDGVSTIGPVSVTGLDTDLGEPWEFEFSPTDGEYIDFYSVSSATFSAAVPEPATWAMMLFGIGLTGGLIRRRARSDREFKSLRPISMA